MIRKFSDSVLDLKDFYKLGEIDEKSRIYKDFLDLKDFYKLGEIDEKSRIYKILQNSRILNNNTITGRITMGELTKKDFLNLLQLTKMLAETQIATKNLDKDIVLFSDHKEVVELLQEIRQDQVAFGTRLSEKFLKLSKVLEERIKED